MGEEVNIEGLSKAAVLAALFNSSHQQGMGFMDSRGAKGMTEEDAQKELDLNPRLYFDYLRGRVMKVDLKSDVSFAPYLYDRDCGQGTAAADAIERLRQAATTGG